MIRWMGGILILLGGLWMGNRKARVLEERVETLESLIIGISLLGRELTLHATPLPELFDRLSEPAPKAAGALFRCCAGGLEGPLPQGFCTFWTERVEEIPHLKGEERRLLASLGAVLGRFPAGEQQQTILQVCTLLQESVNAAAADSRRMGRVYRTLGGALGGFLLILLL